LAATERLAERGWQGEVGYDDKSGQLTLTLRDREAAPVTGLIIEAMLSRPATAKEDRAIKLIEAEPGIYAVTVKLDPGLWVISVASGEGSNASDPVYRLKHRLFVAERP
jgi:nitrogen fixation protein FixH